MSDEQLAKAPGILHVPTVIGAVAVIYNVPGVVAGLKLDGETLAEIFMGRIKSWNDSKLKRLNAGANLPSLPITVVHRSDGSGTTNIFTDYLSHASTAWAGSVGKSSAVNWPAGLGAKGNEGVAGQVKGLNGAIGYSELAYAETNHLTYASVMNRAGEFIPPSVQSTTAAAAAAAASMPSDLRVSIVDPAGRGAYPISGFTYILVYREQNDARKGQTVAQFLWWAIHDGQTFAPPLFYAPLPASVVQMDEAKIRSIVAKGGKPFVS